MPFAPHPKRAEFDARVEAGEDPKAVGVAIGVHPGTVRLWTRKAKPSAPASIADDEDAGDARAPHVGKEPIAAKPKPKRSRATAITEKTAGRLIQMGFLMAAIRQQEPERLLKDFERDELGASFADSLSVVPAPIASAINAYASPFIFVGELYGVIEAQNNRIAAKRARRPITPSAGKAPVIASNPLPENPPAPPVSMNVDLAEAVAAMHGTLTADDDVDNAERAFAGA